MSLSLDQVRQIAALARLRLDPAEEGEIGRQLAEIVAYVDELRQLDLDAGEAQAKGSDLPPQERADEPAPGLERETFLRNAPQVLDGFLVVPEVKGDG